MLGRGAGRSAGPRPTPSPNIWHWPDVYEVENTAQDRSGAIWATLADVADFRGLDVVDVGCGAGFHLPRFAAHARSVVGIEPHPPLVALAAARVAATPGVRVLRGVGQALPLPADSADVVHARTACFFGPGCGAALTEANRVLRPGGVLVVVDLDAGRSRYGEWMRADIPSYDPVAVEAFFVAEGFSLRRVSTRWAFDRRADLAAVLGIEFSPAVAARALAETPGLELEVAYRVHWRRRSLVTV